MDRATPARYQFRQMTRHDLPAARAFIQRMRPAARVQGHAGWLPWQYQDNPAGFDVRLCLHHPKSGEEGDEPRLVGLSGFLPYRFRIDDRTVRGAFSTSTMLDEAHRRRGLGQQFHLLRLRDYDVALSSGQSARNREVYRSLGFVLCGDYRQLLVQSVRPPLRLTRRGLARWYSWLVFRRLDRRRLGAALDGDLRVETTRTLPAMSHDLFDNRFPDEAVGPEWNRAHVVWRYAEHPYFAYRFATVFRTDAPIGVAVLRETPASTILADIYCRHADFSDVLHGVARVASPPLTGKFVGRYLTRRFRQAGWVSFRAGNQLLGKSNDPQLLALLRTRSWCFFAGDSDVDR